MPQASLLSLRIAFVLFFVVFNPTFAQDSPTTRWLRQKVNLNGALPEEAELRVSSSGNVSVYLNGQRLLKAEQATTGVLQFAVGSLLRNGENCVALSISGTTEPEVGVLLLSTAANLPSLGDTWKTAPEPPPVGWQQTDFNDRDWTAWKAAKSLSADELRTANVTQIEWQNSTKPRYADGKFAFREGDHVVLLGGTFIERAQSFGHLECALLQHVAGKHVTMRNLGWSADTVFAESRGIFDSPEKGYLRMIEHVRAEEPSVILVSYGQNEALSFAAGDAGLTRFRDGLQKLCGDLQTTGAELVLLSPHPFLTAPPPIPDASRWNPRLLQFADVVRDVAASRNCAFVDLQSSLDEDMQKVHVAGRCPPPAGLTDLQQHPALVEAIHSVWTDNGMHWTSAGYAAISPVLASRLTGTPLHPAEIVIDLTKRTATASGGELRDIQWDDAGGQIRQLQFRALQPSVVPLRIDLRSDMTMNLPETLSVSSSGEDGLSTELMVCPSTDSDDKQLVFTDDQNQRYERLRQLVVRKNELYFHRWRPQNITYLFGFRKHEQGNNASEIAQFDPLIAELERQIAAASAPEWVRITFSQSSAGNAPQN